MDELFQALQYYMISLPIFVLLGWVLCRWYDGTSIAYPHGFIVGWQLLAVYLCGIFSVTGTAGMDDILRYGTALISAKAVNWLPFIEGGTVGMFLNILLFVPLGALLPLLWKHCSMWQTVGTGFMLSLLIELSQLFNYRATDVDDLLMNTLGTLLGYAVYALILRRIAFLKAEDIRGGAAALGSVCAIFAVYGLFASPVLSQIWLVLFCR